MTGLLESLQSGDFTMPGLSLMLDAAVKGAAVLILALAASLGLRRASASARHLLWLLTIASLIILPITSLVMPSWQWRILPGRMLVATDTPERAEPVMAASEERATNDHIQFAPTPAPLADFPHTALDFEADLLAQNDRVGIGSTNGENAEHAISTAPTPAKARSVSLHWSVWLLLAWFAGGNSCHHSVCDRNDSRLADNETWDTPQSRSFGWAATNVKRRANYTA